MAFRPGDPEDTLRDRPFEDFRVPRTDKAKAVVADVLNQMQHYEQHCDLRKRKRKVDDQKTFEATVATIVCDLCHRWISEPEGWVAVSLSNDTLSRAGRYKSPALNKTLPTVLERLASADMRFIELNKGFRGYFNNGRQTTIRAGKRLISRIEDHCLNLSDLAVEAHQEVIILKTERTDVFTHGKPIDYQDDDKTVLYRGQMHRINGWLAQADILLDSYFADLRGVDGTERFLRRIFNNSSFEAGGRLFGGFWQSLGQRERFLGVYLKGSPIVVLDYAQMAPSILYGMAGVKPPEEDLYTIPVLLPFREGIKKVFNTLLFVDKPPNSFPKGTRKLFHRSEKIQRVVDEIIKLHQPISKFFFTKIGFRTMFIESQIMVDVLLTFMERDIVGLPIHDGIIVAEVDRDEAMNIMMQAFKRHTGIDGKVTIEDNSRWDNKWDGE